ncbi:bifunctional metallophosphatase/5'-nucleotidase [Labilibacter marinus]|uniref:bifunctional metallophosphatase/5'-nucleotidase n=1 Tax=Labilibacter marinus TaxID=1477105 RepID=UPI00082F7092|nr:bifunctional UDP-sugar hydrolase/5'-nucleotidase [Labilibacter marinus]
MQIFKLKNTLHTLLLLAVVFVFSACNKEDNSSPAPTPADKKEDINESIVILHINDVHGNIDAFPQMAAFINGVKDTCENVFVLCAGDVFSGNPMVDMHLDKGYPMIDLMNKINVDLAVIGNHEFDYGQTILNQRIAQAEFPFICANIDATSGILNQPEAYKVLKSKEGFEIVTLGLIETGTKVEEKYIPSTHPDKVLGCEFPYYKTEIKKYTHLKEKDNLFIILSHLGIGSDETLANDNPEIDLIIGGHSHATVHQPQIFNNALVCQAGSNGKHIGVVHIQVKNKAVVSKNAYLKNMNDYGEKDDDIQEVVNDYNNNNNPILYEKLGTATHPLNSKDELGSLMTDAITWKYNVDIAFQNSGGIRNKLPEGDILAKDVYKIDPFGNEVIKFTLTHKELFTLIKNSRMGDLKPSGMQIVYYQSGYIGLNDMQGNRLDVDKTYTVAMNSYIASAYNFEHVDSGENTKETSVQALIDYIKFKKQIDYKDVIRIFNE